MKTTAKLKDDEKPAECVHGIGLRLKCGKCAKAQWVADAMERVKAEPDMKAGRDGAKLALEYVKTDLDSEKHRVPKNNAVSALEYLASRGVIEPHQYQAASLYCRLADQSGSSPQVTYDPDAGGGGGSDPFTLTRILAIEFVNRVYNELSDRDASIVDWLCTQDMGLEQIRRKGARVYPSDRPSPWAEKRIPQTVRNALERLAEVTGHATKSGVGR